MLTNEDEDYFTESELYNLTDDAIREALKDWKSDILSLGCDYLWKSKAMIESIGNLEIKAEISRSKNDVPRLNLAMFQLSKKREELARTQEIIQKVNRCSKGMMMEYARVQEGARF